MSTAMFNAELLSLALMVAAATAPALWRYISVRRR